MNKRNFLILGLVLASILTKANALEFRLINFDGSDSTLKYAEKGKVVAVSASENHLLALGTNRGKGENLGLARINLKVDRQATANERIINLTDLDSTHASVFHPRHQHPDFAR